MLFDEGGVAGGQEAAIQGAADRNGPDLVEVVEEVRFNGRPVVNGHVRPSDGGDPPLILPRTPRPRHAAGWTRPARRGMLSPVAPRVREPPVAKQSLRTLDPVALAVALDRAEEDGLASRPPDPANRPDESVYL